MAALCPLLLASCREPIAENETSSASAANETIAQPAETTTPHENSQNTPVKETEEAAPGAQSQQATTDVAPAKIPEILTKEEQEQGWICLFDGHSLFGWSPDEPDVDWRVENGILTAENGPNGLLLTKVPFENFEIICEFRMAAGGNSGLFLRTVPNPQDIAKDCYEVNIADSQGEGYLTGSLVKRAKTEPADLQGSGDWKTLRVRALKNHFVVQLDGEQVLDYTDESPDAVPSGFVGLQKNHGRIEFRKVILRPLEMTSLFNGEDLTGWRVVPGAEGTFELKENAIHSTGGPAFLETEQVFQDFIFQAQAKTNAPELNSGIFFRAQQGTEEAPSNGYELQIHNGFKNGDRSQPNNSGTGAIFRRVEARRVVSDDHEWLTATLVAYDSRMMVWVNGYAVVDWEDTREPHENPRQGLRKRGGHFSLQGHDPTTDVLFRQISVSEYTRAPAER